MAWNWNRRSLIWVSGTMLSLTSATIAEAQARPSTSVPGRLVSAPAPDRDGVLKVLLYHDMEGLAGQADERTYSYRDPYDRRPYAYGRELLMADVNAVVDGLFAGGADSVFIVDGHGSGNTEPDIMTEKLDPRAKQLFRDERFGAYSIPPVLSDLVPPGTYDAVAVVGQHGGTGGQGFSRHTNTPNILPYFNGVSITETDNLALAWGRQGMPLIFVSGDDQLREEIRESLSWVEFVVTKKSRNGVVVELLPVDQVRAELREKARVAMSDWRNMKAVTLTTPIRGALQAFAPHTLEPLRGVPGITFDGDQVAFTAPDYRAALSASWALTILAIRLGRTGDLPLPGGEGRWFHGEW